MQRLGRGATAEVFLDRCAESHRLVALKRFRDTDDDTEFLREIDIMRDDACAASCFLLTAVGFSAGEIKYPYLDCGDLETHLRSHGPLTVDDALKAFCDVSAGLSTLHRSGFLHRDIKPANLFWNALNRTMIIGDFGLARRPTCVRDDVARTDREESQPMTTYTTTRWYRAPEILRREAYSFSVDMFAAGLVIMECIRGKAWLCGYNAAHQLELVEKNLFNRSDARRSIRAAILETREKTDHVNANTLNHLLFTALLFDPAVRLSADAAQKYCHNRGMREPMQLE